MWYVLLGKLSISLRLCFFISKMGLAVLPSWSPEVVRHTESRAGLKSQDACVCVPAKVPTNQVTLGSNFRGQSLSCLICMPECVCVLLTQWRPAPCNPMDCSPLGSSVHEILQMLGQIISQFLSSIDILYVESPVIPQGLKLCSRLLIFRAELGLEPRTF